MYDLRSGKVIKGSDKYEIISDGVIHTLIVKKSTVGDEAEYICTAVNVKTSTKLKVEGMIHSNNNNTILYINFNIKIIF